VEAYLSAGYSLLDASVAGMLSVSVPQASGLNDLAKQMTELQKQYTQAGDDSSAEAVRLMVQNLASQLETQANGTLINELTGFAIEKKFLSALSSDAAYGADGRTVGSRLAEINSQIQSIRGLTSLTDMLPNLPDWEVIAYFDRVRLNGEIDALLWLQNRHGNVLAP
jgi:hypothetical protein